MGTLQDLVVSVLRSPFVVGFASVLLLLNSPGLNSSLLNIGVAQVERLTHNGRVQNGDQALYPFIRFLSPFLGALATTYGKQVTLEEGGRTVYWNSKGLICFQCDYCFLSSTLRPTRQH